MGGDAIRDMSQRYADRYNSASSRGFMPSPTNPMTADMLYGQQEGRGFAQGLMPLLARYAASNGMITPAGGGGASVPDAGAPSPAAGLTDDPDMSEGILDVRRNFGK